MQHIAKLNIAPFKSLSAKASESKDVTIGANAFYLDNEDFLAFKKSVPTPISSFYQQLVSSKKGRGVSEKETK